MTDLLKIDAYAPSIHYRKRTQKIKYIIIHCSAPTPQEQIKILNELGLSTHYILGKDGKLIENLSPSKVAFHAGASHWYKTRTKSLNGSSIGIEIENETLGQKSSGYSDKTIKKLCLLLKHLVKKYNIKPENILGHSDIAPTRKPDPGAGFPWLYLHKQGLIPWYNLKNRLNQTNEINLFKTIGYETTNLPATRYAFCRRYIPEEIKIEKNLQTLLDNPFPKDFMPKDAKKYLNILQAVAYTYKKARHPTSF